MSLMIVCPDQWNGIFKDRVIPSLKHRPIIWNTKVSWLSILSIFTIGLCPWWHTGCHKSIYGMLITVNKKPSILVFEFYALFSESKWMIFYWIYVVDLYAGYLEMSKLCGLEKIWWCCCRNFTPTQFVCVTRGISAISIKVRGRYICEIFPWIIAGPAAGDQVIIVLVGILGFSMGYFWRVEMNGGQSGAQECGKAPVWNF